MAFDMKQYLERVLAVAKMSEGLNRWAAERVRDEGKLTTAFDQEQKLWEASFVGSDLIGCGKTEAEAITDLMMQLD